MTGWADRPLAAFDTETTGVDVEGDRIVTACLATVNTVVPVTPATWLINPGIEIPEAASSIHGVTTEQARQHGVQPGGALVEIRARIIDAWDSGHTLVAYNASFDLTILDRELRRYGLPGLDAVGPVVDPLVLDRYLDPYRRGKRTLEAACAHYAVRLDGAHDAAHDAIAAARVAWRIARRYPEIADLDADDLFALQVGAHRGWAAHFEDYLRSQGKGDVIDRSWPIRCAGAGVSR